MQSKTFWKSSRRSQPEEMDSAAVAVAPSPAGTAVLEPVSPFVRQLMSQADSLNEISRRVESQMKREGIPVLAATREFVEFASARGSAATAARNGHTAVDTRPQFDVDDEDVELIDDLPAAPPAEPSAFATPFLNQAAPVDTPPAPLPVDDYPLFNGASSQPYNLEVAPFPILSDDSASHADAPIAFVAPVEAAPTPVVDHVLADWIDPKEFHGNDRARAYDIDSDIDVDPFQVPAFTPTVAAESPVVEVSSIEVEAEAPVIDYAAELARKAPLADVLSKISCQYRNRAQTVAGTRAQSDLADAALEPDIAVAPQEIKRVIPGQIAHPYMVTVHGNLEIPKVPPYIWSAPELPWDRDEAQDPLAAWFNCTGNRYQLAMEF